MKNLFTNTRNNRTTDMFPAITTGYTSNTDITNAKIFRKGTRPLTLSVPITNIYDLFVGKSVCSRPLTPSNNSVSLGIFDIGSMSIPSKIFKFIINIRDV